MARVTSEPACGQRQWRGAPYHPAANGGRERRDCAAPCSRPLRPASCVHSPTAPPAPALSCGAWLAPWRLRSPLPELRLAAPCAPAAPLTAVKRRRPTERMVHPHTAATPNVASVQRQTALYSQNLRTRATQLHSGAAAARACGRVHMHAACAPRVRVAPSDRVAGRWGVNFSDAARSYLLLHFTAARRRRPEFKAPARQGVAHRAHARGARAAALAEKSRRNIAAPRSKPPAAYTLLAR